MTENAAHDASQTQQACKAALAERRFGDAKKLAGRHFQAHPQDLWALELIAEAKAGQGNTANAIDYLIRYSEQFLSPNVAVGREEISRAIDFLVRCTERYPNEPYFPFQIGLFYGRLSRHGWAEGYLRRAVELAPQWPDANFRLGQNLSKAGRPKEAIPYLRAAAAGMPGKFKAAFLLGNAFNNVGEFEEAATWMAKAQALRPNDVDVAFQAKELFDIAKAPPKPGRFARWPEAAAEFMDLMRVVREYIVPGFDSRGFCLKPGMTVLTQGSCFAGNLANSFRRYDLSVGNIPFGEEHNSTYANRAVIRWLRDGVTDELTEIVAENFGRDTRDSYRDVLKRCDMYVYTLGVAPAFFGRKTGEFVMPRQTASSTVALVRNNIMRTTSVAENIENLRFIVDAVKEFNPNATIVLTVSPVPLRSTSEMSSAIVGDCISKSTLRVAAHEVIQENIPGVLYWPSFEIVRWIGAHRGAMYGNDDGSSHHVDFAVIDVIIDSFIETVGHKALIPVR